MRPEALSTHAYLLASTAMAAPRGMSPPRLITQSEADLAVRAASDAGPPIWLLAFTIVITLATLAWWAWWWIRFRSSAMNEAEHAYRRLSRIVGLRRTDREWFRDACRRAGVEPLAALASPSLAALALSGEEPRSQRLRRLRAILCDTSPDLAGRSVA